MEVLQNFNYSLKMNAVTSCRFISSPDLEQVYVALSGSLTDTTYVFNVSQEIQPSTDQNSLQNGIFEKLFKINI